MVVLTPLLSEEDPAVSSEGAIDPLGLYTIADGLGVRLAPGVRERQSRPRWLTVMAVGMVVCDAFPPEQVAADGESEPWQVFEWYVVEGLVRTASADDDLKRLPGLLKARQAVFRDQVPLSASRYLKAPSVYGFHGVYRQLARALELESAGRLGETGIQLVETWMDEQHLQGFLGTIAGPGYAIREQLRAAVTDGLEQGTVARKGGWQGWELFRQYMAPAAPGSREARVLARALVEESRGGHRGEVLRAMQTGDGQAIWKAAHEEREFHLWLLAGASKELRQLLEAIIAFEHWGRLLTDSFDDCLQRMTLTRRRTSPSELVRMPNVQLACGKAQEVFEETYRRLQPFETEAAQFRERFAPLSERLSADQWIIQLLEHHRRVQRGKPPNGKNPFFERFDDGSVVVRPGYLRTEGGRGNLSYVHQYRTWPLWTFATDLGMLGNGKATKE